MTTTTAPAQTIAPTTTAPVHTNNDNLGTTGVSLHDFSINECVIKVVSNETEMIFI